MYNTELDSGNLPVASLLSHIHDHTHLSGLEDTVWLLSHWEQGETQNQLSKGDRESSNRQISSPF